MCIRDRIKASSGISGDASYASLSANGSAVAFHGSTGNGLSDIFVTTLSSGAMVRASTASDGTLSNGHSYHASLSGDGGKVAFMSNATNLVAGDTNNTW